VSCDLSEREINLHCARVYLREAQARRTSNPGFASTLLEWAGNARRRAMSERAAQGDLFGGWA
jgi:hypothetical protein